jgi:HlyD family secretion protein
MYKLNLTFIFFIFLIGCSKNEELSDGYGNFEAIATTISSEANGRLLFLNLHEGQKLSKGVLIALVDTTRLHLQRKQIEASLQTLPKKLRNTLADIEVLRNQKSNLVRERDRTQRLVQSKAAIPQLLDDLNGKIEVVEKQIAAIKSQTNIANKSILAETEPLLAQIDIIEDQIKKSYHYNPIEGTVLTKLAESFEVVGMGTPLYRIGKLDTLELKFYTDAVNLQKVMLGQRVQILVDDGKDSMRETEGTISWISEEAEFTPKTIQTKEDRINLVYGLKAKVPNPDGLLKMGMPAEVIFFPDDKSEIE